MSETLKLAIDKLN